MGKFRTLAVMLICTIFFFGLWACTTPAGRTPGQVIDDATITTKVKTKIFGDSILKGFAISVETHAGEVILTGGVKTEMERERAGRYAADTAGVTRVHNLIKLIK